MSYFYHLIKKTPAPVWDENYFPDNFVLTEPGIYAHASVEQSPPVMDRPEMLGATLIGTWAVDGVSIVHDEAEYLAIRPLGNNDGIATTHLGYTQYAGTLQRMLGDAQAAMRVHQLYPLTQEPFDAEARHKYFDTPATPASTGWGFRYELIGEAYTRDPTARAIGVYSDPECIQYLWTTGALQLGPSDWQVDDQGAPLQVWYTNSWDGDRPAEKKDWHIAVLLGSAQEGHATLNITDESIRYLFWEHDQGGGGTFVDSGIQVLSIVGSGVYSVSSTDGLIDGEPIQIDGFDATFVRVHSPGIIIIDPHIATAVGNNIFWIR